MTNPLPPEARPLQGERAGLVSRALADAIDYAIAIVLTGLVWLGVALARLVVHPRSFAWPEWAGTTFLTWYLLLLVASLTVGWAGTGRSVGKRVLGLRLLTVSARRAPIPVALARAIVCVGFPVGLLWAAVDRRNRAVHDFLFRTQVVYDWRRGVPEVADLTTALDTGG
jgi:uncharacterized RDD family membrane protein YckC